MKKKVARLENWNNFYSGLTGEVFGHPNFEDGTRVFTSKVIKLCPETNTAETMNTIYQLGVMAPTTHAGRNERKE